MIKIKTMRNLTVPYSELLKKLYIQKGLNKTNEIKRLIFEIMKKYDLSSDEFLSLSEINKYINTGKFNYHYLKRTLLKLRYPESFSMIKENNVYLPELRTIPREKKYLYTGEFVPRKIYVEKVALQNSLTQNLIKFFPDVKVEIIHKLKELRSFQKDHLDTLGKDELFLVVENFDIFKSCPCSPHVHTCNYFILNVGFGCVYDCSYCYLQHYANFQGIILPVNIEDILNELSYRLKKIHRPMRIGTGEFTDSLVFDHLIPYSKFLVPFFHRFSHSFELKTKSTNITNLLRLRPGPTVVVSWSINTPWIIKTEELYTPSLKQRLEAARTVIKSGYKVGFHFDPIIYYDHWEDDYKHTIQMMHESAKDNIAWISLGALRFHRSLKPIIEQRFPGNQILDGELIMDKKDRKMRYPKSLRIMMFKKMLGWIRHLNKDVWVYLCMEPEDVWRETFK